MNEQLTREKFEHWMSDEGENPKAVGKDSKGDYLLAQTSWAWVVWRGAWESAVRYLEAGQ